MEVGVDLVALASWMGERGLGRGLIEDAQRLAGGTQNILLRFRLGHREFVLRSPPQAPRPGANAAMLREARLLRALAQTDIPHPRFIAASGDESPLGTAFYLMEPVEGFTPNNGLPELHAGSQDIRHRMGLAAIEAAAALGSADHVALGLEDFGRPGNFLARQVDRWKSLLVSYASKQGWPGPSALPAVDSIAAWLAERQPREFQPGIMHGDFHLANVMYRFDGPEIAAVVDWEMATIGDPLLDLGWLLATWPEADGSGGTVHVQPWNGFATAEELISHYASRSDRDLTNVRWYAVLACYKLGIVLEGTYARACAGEAPMDVGETLHGRTIDLLERAERWIEQ